MNHRQQVFDKNVTEKSLLQRAENTKIKLRKQKLDDEVMKLRKSNNKHNEDDIEKLLVPPELKVDIVKFMDEFDLDYILSNFLYSEYDDYVLYGIYLLKQFTTHKNCKKFSTQELIYFLIVNPKVINRICQLLVFPNNKIKVS